VHRIGCPDRSVDPAGVELAVLFEITKNGAFSGVLIGEISVVINPMTRARRHFAYRPLLRRRGSKYCSARRKLSMYPDAP
jgi:hypothetical protein